MAGHSDGSWQGLAMGSRDVQGLPRQSAPCPFMHQNLTIYAKTKKKAELSLGQVQQGGMKRKDKILSALHETS